MVLKNCGPKGYPGMAEVGNMALPPKLLKQGITDMVRISDARMSGTAYGTVVLHVCARSGGRRPAGAGARRRHDRARRARRGGCTSTSPTTSWRAGARRGSRAAPPMSGGYQKLYVEHVLQADTGADLDFLVGCRGAVVARESH